jgi:hypothetical protein
LRNGVIFDSSKQKLATMEKQLTYDIQFDNNENSNSNGFKSSLQECKDYISQHNGSDKGYFADYKGGTVSVVCNDTDEIVYSETVK